MMNRVGKIVKKNNQLKNTRLSSKSKRSKTHIYGPNSQQSRNSLRS